MAADFLIPCWLFDTLSVRNEIVVIHTCHPRFIGRFEHTESVENSTLGAIAIEGGWTAIPMEWIDRFDEDTFDVREMTASLENAWKRFDFQ